MRAIILFLTLAALYTGSISAQEKETSPALESPPQIDNPEQTGSQPQVGSPQSIGIP
jgi:hypothetical protein